MCDVYVVLVLKIRFDLLLWRMVITVPMWYSKTKM